MMKCVQPCSSGKSNPGSTRFEWNPNWHLWSDHEVAPRYFPGLLDVPASLLAYRNGMGTNPFASWN
jgi:hypothetical protein